MNHYSEYQRAFMQSFECYQEMKTVRGSAFGTRMYGGDTASNAQFKPNLGVSLSDYVADFELTCLRVLKEVEAEFFKSFFIQGKVVRWKKMLGYQKRLFEAVTEKAGRALVAYGLSPAGSYFKESQ